jgi:pyrroline-5-carboxylate reductase
MKVLQIGKGNMGGVIADIIVKKGYDLTIVDKFADGCIRSLNDESLPLSFDIILIAVKPQNFDEIADELRWFCHEETVVVSIMAGSSVATLRKRVKKAYDVTRVMPNIGMKSGCGISLVFNSWFPSSKKFVQEIFGSDGNVILQVDSDEEIDRLTPFTGSGAALFLKLASILTAEFAKSSGANLEKSREIVMKILTQAFEMSAGGFDEAIAKIASKGGITEAMLNAFETNLPDAIAAGQKKALQL